LWIDDARALAWMAPDGARGVQVLQWTEGVDWPAPGDVVVEAFGCDLPPAFIARMSQGHPQPLWINLEYLSAEAYVRRSHGLPSPQLSGPGRGLTKWFHYPGFEDGTGGLIRETQLMAERESFDARAWLQEMLAALGQAVQPGERVVSLFCYPDAPVPLLLEILGRQPTLLLLTPGAAAQAVSNAGPHAPALRCVEPPWLCQSEFDRLLWACELNFVRGEDSFVRAQWAGAPFVWQIYAQSEDAHAVKLDAFMQLFLAGADAAVATDLRALWRAWNGLGPWPVHLPAHAPWTAAALRWRSGLLQRADLVTQLLGFVHERR
jgi:uncharacterized repeat protein (TIGR03837 family)